MGCCGTSNIKYRFEDKDQTIKIKDQQVLTKVMRGSIAKRKVQKMIFDNAKSIAGKSVAFLISPRYALPRKIGQNSHG